MSNNTKTKSEAEANVETSLYTIVNGIDNDGEPWKEAADVHSFTSSGISFQLAKKCSVGTLISLMLNLPSHMRCYDHGEEFYRVWGLVQHCHLSSNDEGTSYQIGVAFIGDEPPATYGANALQNYRICGMSEDGLWNVTESDSKFVHRKELRYWTQIRPYLALIDSRRETIGGEWGSTENVSRSGAAVISRLDLNVGDRLKFISEEFDFSGLAVVCNAQEQEDGKRRLSLEFVENDFPIELVESRSKSNKQDPLLKYS
jgi:PilZ domain